jgi:chromosomal replication initiator protein
VARPSTPANDADLRRPSLTRTFDSFVVGHANKVAHAAAKAIAEDREPPFRLAVIHGAYGSGKSHLLSAVAAAAHGREVLYFNADRFRAEYVKSLKASAGLEFKDRVRAADILLIDDLHLLSGAKSTQTELYHAINDVLSEGGRVVVAADRPADDLTDLDPRLRSRLIGAVGCPIERPDLDLRRRILESMAAAHPFVKRGLEIPTEVLDFLASAITQLPRDLEGALGTVLTRTALIGLPVTRETAREALTDVLAGSNRRVTVEEIQKTVASYHGMQVSALLSKRRTRDIVRPRQEAMYLCKEFTTRSLPDIARRFGGMDHTTVMHACKRVKDLMKMDPSVRGDIDALRRLLTQQRDQPSA